MTASAQLHTGNFKLTGLNRFKPKQRLHPGNGVLLDAHLRDEKAVPPIHSGEMHEEGPVSRCVELITETGIVHTRILQLET